jgi:hypothetical protein
MRVCFGPGTASPSLAPRHGLVGHERVELLVADPPGDELDVKTMSTSARNQPQTREPENGCNQPNRRLAETRRNRLRRNGKEGVDGSSPSEGSAKSAARWRLLVQIDLLRDDRAVGMESFMELSG